MTAIQKRKSRRAQQALEKLMLGISMALDGCREYLSSHPCGKYCRCEDIKGIRHNMEFADAILGSSLCFFPGEAARRRKEAAQRGDRDMERAWGRMARLSVAK
jgi:hypothetical protein